MISPISSDKVVLSADLVDESVLNEVELAASKNALNSNTEVPLNIANLADVIELDKLLFKLLKILLVVRVIQDDNVINIEELNCK